MSRIFDALRKAESNRQRGRNSGWDIAPRSFHVVTVASNKGGVGKTTVATNLAIYLRALREDLPILILGLDDQPMLDRMFSLGAPPKPNIEHALRSGNLISAIQLGQYGVYYVSPSATMGELKAEFDDPFRLQEILLRLDWKGIIIVDTKSDLEILTQNAIAASDLTIVVVADQASLHEAEKVFDLLARWKMPRQRARVLLSMLDLRIKYRGKQDGDILALLTTETLERGYPLFGNYLSRSAKVEALHTNPSGQARSILHAAEGSLVNRQFRHIAEDVLKALDPLEEESSIVGLLRALSFDAGVGMPTNPLRIANFPCYIGRDDPLVQNHVKLQDNAPFQISRRHAAIVEQDGRLGIADMGSRLGSLVDGQQVGGPQGHRGPVFFEGKVGQLRLGSPSSPFVYEVRREQSS